MVKLLRIAACSTVLAASLASPLFAADDTVSRGVLTIAQVSTKASSGNTVTLVGRVNENNNVASVPMWQLMLFITGAGAISGALNALISDNGFILPGKKNVNGVHIFHPGFVGNILTGAFAGFISWGIYGPSATNAVIGRTFVNEIPPQVSYLRLSEVAGAILIGLGGARWLTSEVGKRILTVAASEAAKAPSSPDLSQQFSGASPLEILERTTKRNLEFSGDSNERSSKETEK